MNKKLTLLLILFFFHACNTTEKTFQNEMNPEEPLTSNSLKNPEKIKEKLYTNVSNRQEIIKLMISEETNSIIGGTYFEIGNEYPIEFSDMEFSEESGWIGRATSKAWKGEALVGIEGDLSHLGWTDGKIKKKFEL